MGERREKSRRAPAQARELGRDVRARGGCAHSEVHVVLAAQSMYACVSASLTPRAGAARTRPSSAAMDAAVAMLVPAGMAPLFFVRRDRRRAAEVLRPRSARLAPSAAPSRGAATSRGWRGARHGTRSSGRGARARFEGIRRELDGV